MSLREGKQMSLRAQVTSFHWTPRESVTVSGEGPPRDLSDQASLMGWSWSSFAMKKGVMRPRGGPVKGLRVTWASGNRVEKGEKRLWVPISPRAWARGWNTGLRGWMRTSAGHFFLRLELPA